MARDAVILLSGGLDSVVLAYDLVRQGRQVRAVHFNIDREAEDYEFNAAKNTALTLDFPFEAVDLCGMKQMMLGFMDVDGWRGEADIVCPDVSAVPSLVAMGMYYAQLAGIGELYLATIREQTAGRPSLPQFFDALSDTSRLFDPKYTEVRICNPYLTKSKAEVIELGQRLGVPFERTWSCHFALAAHCGKCPGCQARTQGFTSARVADPTRYLA
jgi:7-cyano-7-deazaguanine synthase